MDTYKNNITRIYRTDKTEGNFTQFSNSLLDDIANGNLTHTEFTVLVYAISKPDWWKWRAATVQQELNISESTYKRVIKSLRDKGYLEYALVYYDNDDHRSVWKYHVYEYKNDELRDQDETSRLLRFQNEPDEGVNNNSKKPFRGFKNSLSNNTYFNTYNTIDMDEDNPF